MGGKALKRTTTRRYGSDEYFGISAVVEGCLGSSGVIAKPITSYREKKDYGDLDVLVLSGVGVHEAVINALSAQGVSEIVRNGPVWSVGWGDFQVDLIFQPRPSFDFAWRYFCWGDLGNLIGRTAHRLGFKFGHDGLSYVLRDGDYQIKSLYITQSFDEALGFLGFSPERHQEGFDALTDTFEYASSTPYFDPSGFALEKRNYAARVRDAKRPVYRAFLEWIDARQWPEISSEDRSEWLDAARVRFPEFAHAMDNALSCHEEQKAMRARFNGNVVSEITGLQGKDLGALMASLKRSSEYQNGFDGMSDGDFHTWILRYVSSKTSNL